MKLSKTLRDLGVQSPDEGFKYFMGNLRPSLKLWDYFVNWDKVFKNTRSLEVHLNIWNYLLGKDDFDVEFHALLGKHPEIVSAIPSLIVRDGANSSQFAVIEDLVRLGEKDSEFDFSIPASTQKQREAALDFIKKSGLHRLFKKDGVKNLVDYVLGVEAGLDSNGRKNRSGTSMETVVEAYLSAFTSRNQLEYISQATAPRIKEKWGFDVPVDKSTRRFDFAISNGTKLALMEVNFYGGGGSKLKATAGEYKGLFNLLDVKGYEFIWVTDGEGWKTTERPLREAFELIHHIWNLKMLTAGCIRDIFQ